MDESTKSRLKAEILRTLKELVAIPGVSGFEHRVVAYLKDAFAPLADRVEIDSFGNLYAYKSGGRPGPTFMVAAHSDEVGFIVRAIEEKGFIRFDRLGGAPENMLLGQRVLVNGRHKGVIGVKSGHLQRLDEGGAKPTKLYDMFIELGAKNAADVAAMDIKVGDPITFDYQLTEYSGTDRFFTKALDDRWGVAILLQLMREVQGRQFDGTLVAACTVQEEVGLRGATVAAFKVNPDYAIAVDTMPAGDTPDVRTAIDHPVYVGRGPVFTLATGTGTTVNPGVKAMLYEAAEAAGVPYQPALMLLKGNTDASAMQLAREGIPVGNIGLPRRFSHSSAETADQNDGLYALLVLMKMVENMGQAREKLKFI